MTTAHEPRERTRARRRAAMASAVRATATVTGLVALYYLLPLRLALGWDAAPPLIVGLLILVGLLIFQVRSISAAPYPLLRAIEALATSVPLFLLLFATTYVVMSAHSAANFNTPLGRTDALYFTVTVFSTVGFGDITATSEPARLAVTVQMLANIVLVGIAIRAIANAVRRRR